MKKFVFPFILLVILAVWLFFKKSPMEYYKVSGNAQGTTYSVIYGSSKKLDLSDSIARILEDFDLTFSSYVPHSLISKINNTGDPMEVDPTFQYVYKLSAEINKLTWGAFDLTVAPLVNAWGFGWKNNQMPGQEKLDSLLQIIGMDKISLADGKLHKKDPRVQIDVNAVAQGYSVDVVAEYLESLGIENYLVEIGGELRGRGKKQNGHLWKIGIERPTENNDLSNRPLQATIELEDMSMATSGNYRKFYEKDGAKIVHTIDPKTGRSIQSNLLSATVLTAKCAKADALATGFMVLGLDKSISLADSLTDVDAYFIYSDSSGNFHEWASEGFLTLLQKEKDLIKKDN
jgi:FAD:protein FMN transferase